MSRTWKRFPANSCFRSPKGHRQARRAGVRRSKVPPDDYEDISYDKQCWLPYRVADRLAEKGWPAEAIAAHLAKKFNVRLSDVRWVARMAEEYAPPVPEGYMKVYKERRE